MAGTAEIVTKPPNRADGFTLIELLVVLVILALSLTVTSIFVASRAPTEQLKSTARTIASAIRLTQSEAIKRNQEIVLVIDVEGRRYRVGDGLRDGALPGDLTFEIFTAQSERVGKTAAGIRFFPDGSSTGGKITVANGQKSYEIAVNWLTGNVAIVE